MEIINKIKKSISRIGEDKYNITIERTRVNKGKIAPIGACFFVAKSNYNGMKYELPILIYMRFIPNAELEVKMNRGLKDRLVEFIKKDQEKRKTA